jgi:hypothetical protein
MEFNSKSQPTHKFAFLVIDNQETLYHLNPIFARFNKSFMLWRWKPEIADFLESSGQKILIHDDSAYSNKEVLIKAAEYLNKEFYEYLTNNNNN